MIEPRTARVLILVKQEINPVEIILPDFRKIFFSYFDHHPKRIQTNDASFESSNIELLESGNKLCVVSS